MRVQIMLAEDTRYTANVEGALAGWDNKSSRLSYITLYGTFPNKGVIQHEYTIHFRTEIAFSVCKKLEKEGTADLATDYMRSFIISTN